MIPTHMMRYTPSELGVIISYHLVIQGIQTQQYEILHNLLTWLEYSCSSIQDTSIVWLLKLYLTSSNLLTQPEFINTNPFATSVKERLLKGSAICIESFVRHFEILDRFVICCFKVCDL
jgi:hypothetical protein